MLTPMGFVNSREAELKIQHVKDAWDSRRIFFYGNPPCFGGGGLLARRSIYNLQIDIWAIYGNL